MTYEQLAMMSVAGRDIQVIDLTAMMQKKAASLGANAVIIQETEGAPYIFRGKIHTRKELIGIAIRIE